MKDFAAGIIIGAIIAIGTFWVTPEQKHEIKVSGAIAVYEGKATCEKALDQWICKVRRN